jgi:hypothetical protein
MVSPLPLDNSVLVCCHFGGERDFSSQTSDSVPFVTFEDPNSVCESVSEMFTNLIHSVVSRTELKCGCDVSDVRLYGSLLSIPFVHW